MLREPEVFDERWAPGDIRHRDSEADALAAALRPLLEGRAPQPVLVWGDSGSGKTCTTQFVLDDAAAENDVATLHVNCWERTSTHRILADIHNEVATNSTLTPESVSGDRLYSDLRDQTQDQPAVIALDEADELADQRLLYRLARLSRVALVLIAHEAPAFARSIDDERVMARLRPMTRIEFTPYSTDELADILWDRAEAGLEPGAVDAPQIETIAEVSANAHEAIQTLKSAAEVARRNGKTRIPDSVIRPAQEEAREDLRRRRLQYLGKDQLYLYAIITDAAGERLSQSDVYGAYQAHVDEPYSERWVRDNLRKLADYDLIRMEGETKGRRYLAVENPPEQASVQL